MRYLDSGGDAEDQTLGAWLRSILPDLSFLRWQTGYFSADGLGLLLPVLGAVPSASLVIGSNQKATSGPDVERLVIALGLPRAGVRLGVAACEGTALFHPKVFHVLRGDGSQAAFVGSANLGFPGVAGANVEAGVALDTRDGDPLRELDRISASIDAWFGRQGVFPVPDATAVTDLVARGVLAEQRPPRPRADQERDAAGVGAPRIRRRPLIAMPAVPGLPGGRADGGPDGGPGGRQSRPRQPPVDLAPPDPAAVSQPTYAVLLAEIPKGGGRWNQANFSRDVIHSFFGANPPASVQVTLRHLRPDGSVDRVEERPTVSRFPSSNYSIELEAAAHLAYPAGRDRPIAAFLRLASRDFRYLLLMPGARDYARAKSLLGPPTPGRMRRPVLDSVALRAAWPDCPLLAF